MKRLIVLLMLLMPATVYAYGEWQLYNLERWTIKDQYEYRMSPRWKACDVYYYLRIV